jgi:UDP-N-acetylglucosamine--N-acetylmuramyl-(pentapeptide) pyrophosphoryl-undecaprenol N-acetylglucosamine transferase
MAVRDSRSKGQGQPVICLAASGGGHVRQLLDLEPLWSRYPHFFVTEATALGRSIGERIDTSFVPHFALGQARLGSPFAMFAGAWRSMWRSLRIVWRKRPDVVITTGAGSLMFIVLWARLAGARIILIDSFARFEGPSAFARLMGPLAHRRYAQSTISASKWNGAVAFDPLRPVATPPPVKLEKVFATVGATLAFPRLAQLVIEAKEAGLLPQQVVLQVGEGVSYPDPPDGIEIVETLSFEKVQELLNTAQAVICHGGTGSILTALREHCHVIVIPRRFELGEHYDDHQAEITQSFVSRGLVQCADDLASLRQAIENLAIRQPVAVTTHYGELMEDLSTYLG